MASANKILDFLKEENRPMKVKEIATLLNMSIQETEKTLEELRESDLVTIYKKENYVVKHYIKYNFNSFNVVIDSREKITKDIVDYANKVVEYYSRRERESLKKVYQKLKNTNFSECKFNCEIELTNKNFTIKTIGETKIEFTTNTDYNLILIVQGVFESFEIDFVKFCIG